MAILSGTLDPDVAAHIYDILVEHAGASARKDDKADFVRSQSANEIHEWRFCGSLGFGGKFRRAYDNRRWYVDCYREDETETRRAVITKTNIALARLYEEVSP